MALEVQSGPRPRPPRQGQIWWSAAPPGPTEAHDQASTSDGAPLGGVSEEQLKEWLSCTAGWKALELTWGALQGCEVRHEQLKPLLQAAMAEAARLGAQRLVVRQLDLDEVVGRCVGLALAAFPNFGLLKLKELNLYDECMGHLCGSLHSAEHLRSLTLDTVWASVGGWSALGAAIKVNTSLTTLRIRECLSDTGALGSLCSALADQQGCLAELVLSQNGLGDAGVGELCKALTRSANQPASRLSRVAHLDLSHNACGLQCVPALAAAVRAVRTLRHLDLSNNQLGAEGARDLCRALAYAPHLSSLGLAATGADDAAVEALTRGTLAANASAAGGGLATLCLANNRVSHKGATLLAVAAKRAGCALVDVDLAGNGQIGEAGAKAWAEALSSPAGGSRLRRLVLSGCEVPDEGAYALGAALKTNTCLTELGLAENHISTSGLALLAEVIKVNDGLRVLDVSLNMVGPQGMIPFSQMSHLHGHIYFSKSHDHSVKRVSSCLVKAELLQEYRTVEAVKNSSEPWEQEWEAARRDNPFGQPQGDRSSNPFLSPSASYINPFLDPPAGGAAADPAAARNPFLSPTESYVNPFHSPSGGGAHVGAHDNPFLSPRAVSSDAGTSGDGTGAGVARTASAVDRRQLATRVITKLGRGGRGGGSDDEGSGSGTGVYVSSHSTADEADLVTDLDLRMVEYMLESMGVVPEAEEQGRQEQAAAGAEEVSEAGAPTLRAAVLEAYAAGFTGSFWPANVSGGCSGGAASGIAQADDGGGDLGNGNGRSEDGVEAGECRRLASGGSGAERKAAIAKGGGVPVPDNPFLGNLPQEQPQQYAPPRGDNPFLL